MGSERGIGGGQVAATPEAAGVFDLDEIGFTPEGVLPGAAAVDATAGET
jgi:hypothetical protein